MDLTVSLEEMWRRPAATTATTSTGRGGPAPRWCSTTGTGSTSGSRSTTRTCGGSARHVYYFFTREHLAALHEAVGRPDAPGGGARGRRGGRRQHVLRARRHRHRLRRRRPGGPATVRRRAALRRGAAVVQGPRRHASSTSAAARAARNDSLFSYKAGFSPRPAPVPHLAGGDRPGRVPAAGRRRDPSADPDDMSGTFPSYR